MQGLAAQAALTTNQATTCSPDRVSTGQALIRPPCSGPYRHAAALFPAPGDQSTTPVFVIWDRPQYVSTGRNPAVGEAKPYA